MHNTTSKFEVYKIVACDAWDAACAVGSFCGSIDDQRDGFIHLSTGVQLAGTLAKHFRGKENLLLVAFSAADLGAELKFEPSRGGELFPHLYAPLPTRLALWQRPLSLGPDGLPLVAQQWLQT